MLTSMLRDAAALAAIAVLLSPAVASADPDPANPGGATPVAVVAVDPGPAGPAGPPPIDGVPPIDDGKVVSGPPTTMKATDGATLTMSASDEIQKPISPLTTAISTREYEVGGMFRGAITGSDAPKGVLEVGYQIGCGIDMGTGPGVILGANAGGAGSLGLWGGFTTAGVPPIDVPIFPSAGGLLQGGGSVAVALKPGLVNTVPVTKKQFAGAAPWVSVRGFRVRIDGCVGESFIRSYAVLSRSTEERESILAWYGASKAV